MSTAARVARPLVYSLALAGLLSAIAVLAIMSDRAGDEPPSRRTVPPVDLIAYADSLGRIHLVDPAGLEDRTVSEESGYFTWPAWSPDGSSLAFSGSELDSAELPLLRMRSYDLDTGTTTDVYVNQPGMGPILGRMPHYPIWSPDSSILGIMASERQGLTLLLTEPGLGMPDDVILRNSPLYAGWSSDSSRMLVHAGADHYVVNLGEGVSVAPISTGSIVYRAPSWRAGSDQVALVAADAQGRHELTILDVVSGDSVAVQSVQSTVAFSWSPDGNWLAAGEDLSLNSFTYEGVRLISWDGSMSTDAITAPVAAFYWSPDSRYIAYVTPKDPRGVLEWRVHDIEAKTDWSIAEFVPSREQLTLFLFFDQFSQSHSVWSPASDAIVFAGVPDTEGISAAYRSQTPAQVMVADAMARTTVRVIGSGVLAVWSPR